MAYYKSTFLGLFSRYKSGMLKAKVPGYMVEDERLNFRANVYFG